MYIYIYIDTPDILTSLSCMFPCTALLPPDSADATYLRVYNICTSYPACIKYVFIIHTMYIPVNFLRI